MEYKTETGEIWLQIKGRWKKVVATVVWDDEHGVGLPLPPYTKYGFKFRGETGAAYAFYELSYEETEAVNIAMERLERYVYRYEDEQRYLLSLIGQHLSIPGNVEKRDTLIIN